MKKQRAPKQDIKQRGIKRTACLCETDRDKDM